ncbi:MAG: hypothetical protein AB7S26_03930 [Sandaracinaceae bacterium]
MSLLLDAGALIAFERGDRTVQAFLQRAHDDGVDVRTTTTVVAQTWRSSARQVALARLLRAVDERELTRARARSVGELLSRAGVSDVVDASLVEIAVDGDEILTRDPTDIATLAHAAGKTLLVTPV